MNHILPPEFVVLFSQLHDRAPSYPWPEVRRIVEAELGAPLEQVSAPSLASLSPSFFLRI